MIQGKTKSQITVSSGRERKRCPVVNCTSKVVHLPRHLQDVHKWSKERARTALSRFGIRKEYKFTNPGKAPKKRKNIGSTAKSFDYHYHCLCPVDGCMSLVKRITPHLQKVHHLKPGTKAYLSKYLEARPAVTVSSNSSRNKKVRKCDPEVVVLDYDTKLESMNENFKDEEQVSSPPLTIAFESWLRSADGGNLDVNTSKQHQAQVTKILKVIDGNQKIKCLFDEKIINEKFLEEFAKKIYHPKTIKSYLMSLRHFYCFCMGRDIGVEIASEKLVHLKEKVTRWNSSLSKECSKRHWEKMEKDFHALITPEEIKEFEKSSAARAAICLLGKLSGAHVIEINQSRYTLLRDFLLVEISIDNANRAGALANMRLEDFKKVSKHGEENVVFVREHKTMSTHGPARIVFSPKLYSWMTIFCDQVRSKVQGVNESSAQRVFLSWNGEALSSSQINKGIKSVWRKAGLKGSPSSTLFRKSAVSKVHTNCHDNEEQDNLADLMSHNISTARKYYRLQEKSKSSVKAAQQLRMVMRGQEETRDKGDSTISSPSPLEDSVQPEDSKQPQFENENPDTSQIQVPKLPSSEETLEQRVARLLPDDCCESLVGPSFATSNLKGVFSDEDLKRVSHKFTGMIKNSEPISKQHIKKALEEEEWGSELLGRIPIDTVFNRVKYERRKHRSCKQISSNM